ncbi:dienelactone hydrolase [Nitratireductor sp. XY-223]|uniref:alpha/beta hydrolase family protein n=1 Tax=Nitratireductor sp. XY-223 TaxID=2561926 RepID=UPI0010AB21D8|nr:dienelactone hydrolase [Nitratireductor sp. XY-223]
MKHAIGVAAITGLLCTAALAEDNRVDLIRPDAPALAAHGDSPIGVRTVQITNPGQIDILKVEDGKDLPRYDRPLTLEVWYPAAIGTGYEGVYKDVLLRDGVTKVDLKGRAVRDAEPAKPESAYPLIVVSHGYPGNRFLMSHLGENLATKGYVVVSIDHTESTYDNRAAFGSTLVNRSIDQTFVVDAVDRMSKEDGNFFNGLINADDTGLIGYSMGGYGAVITAGGGVTQASTEYEWGAPAGTLQVHLAGSDTHEALIDPRIKAAVAVAPWGMNTGFWDAAGLSGVRIPMFFIAGSDDDVSGYENGTKAIFDLSTGTDRYLLTFEYANHNAGAPIPAPTEAWQPSEHLDFIPFDHYADAVWDNTRMNNITQHFVSAFFGQYLKGDGEMSAYLDVVEKSGDGVYAVEEDGTLKPEHTYWTGFPNRTAKGLSLMRKAKGE